jgi:hypothetical protein
MSHAQNEKNPDFRKKCLPFRFRFHINCAVPEATGANKQKEGASRIRPSGNYRKKFARPRSRHSMKTIRKTLFATCLLFGAVFFCIQIMKKRDCHNPKPFYILSSRRIVQMNAASADSPYDIDDRIANLREVIRDVEATGGRVLLLQASSGCTRYVYIKNDCNCSVLAQVRGNEPPKIIRFEMDIPPPPDCTPLDVRQWALGGRQ